MPTIKQIIPTLVLAAAGMLASGQVLADRPPTPQERSRIETMLRQEGFTDWGKIELNDEIGVWEAGLFQGRLGFKKAIILLEEGCDEFSNIAGLGQIRFRTGAIKSAFEEVRHVLERESIIPAI